MKYDDELILKAAWYYYIENMTQQAIASKLEISRMKVIRLLGRCQRNRSNPVSNLS